MTFKSNEKKIAKNEIDAQRKTTQKMLNFHEQKSKKNAAIVFKYEIIDLKHAFFDKFEIYVNLI